MEDNQQNIIIYNTKDGKASVSLYAKNGMVWMSQNQIAQLFDTSKQNIGQHISNILKEGELEKNSVVKNYFTTAAEIVLDRANADKPNMSLTSWKGSVVRKQDIFIAKNYLNTDEIDTLNRLVVIFLETAELRAKNRIDITMKFWHENVDRILEFNEQPLLTGRGKISHHVMKEKVRQIYQLFDTHRKAYEAKQADQQDLEELKQLEQKIERNK